MFWIQFTMIKCKYHIKAKCTQTKKSEWLSENNVTELANLLHGLWNPEVQWHIHMGSPIIPILNRINPIPHIFTYLFKDHSNIVLPSMPRPPKGLFLVGIKSIRAKYVLKYTYNESNTKWTKQNT